MKRFSNFMSVNKFYIWILASIFLFACSSKNDTSSISKKGNSIETEMKVIHLPSIMQSRQSSCLEMSYNTNDIICLNDSVDGSGLSQLSILEIRDSLISFIDNNRILCYNLPEGELNGMVYRKGPGPEEYLAITSASISEDRLLYILESKWRTASSVIKIYDLKNNFIGTIQLDKFLGDIASTNSDKGFLISGAVNYEGGRLPIATWIEGSIMDTIFVGTPISAKSSFFQTRKLSKNQLNNYYFESNDTIYGIKLDEQIMVKPYVYIDFDGIKCNNINESGDKILLTSLNIFDNLLFMRFEYNKDIFFMIYDLSIEQLSYLYCVNSSDAKYGVCFNSKKINFCSWPIALWNNDLLFPVPDYVMCEIFDKKEMNPGLLRIPLRKIHDAL